jgi:hypothetical protein
MSLRPVVPEEPAARVARMRLGWADEGAPEAERELVALELAVTQEGSAKPAEVVEALWGAAAAADVACARVALWALDGEDGHRVDPLDLDGLRRGDASPGSLGPVGGSGGAVVAVEAARPAAAPSL